MLGFGGHSYYDIYVVWLEVSPARGCMHMVVHGMAWPPVQVCILRL